jgi:hypothetical protein
MLRFPHASVEKSIFVLFKAAMCQFCPAENARSGALLHPRPLIQQLLRWMRGVACVCCAAPSTNADRSSADVRVGAANNSKIY